MHSIKEPNGDSYIPLPRSFNLKMGDLSGNAVKVFIHILLSASWRPPNQGVYVASYTQIGTDLKMLRQTVYRAVKELSPSLIHVDPGKNQFRASTFSVKDFRTTKDFGSMPINNSELTPDRQRGDSKSPETNVGNALKPSNKKKKDNKKYDHDSDEIKLALRLKERILKNNPNNVIKTSKNVEQRWAKVVDLMISKDNRNPNEIEAIIDYCQSHDFWHKNVLSMEKVRLHYDRFYLELNPKEVEGNQNGVRPTDILVS